MLMRQDLGSGFMERILSSQSQLAHTKFKRLGDNAEISAAVLAIAKPRSCESKPRCGQMNRRALIQFKLHYA
jgi:hypothetical protein